MSFKFKLKLFLMVLTIVVALILFGSYQTLINELNSQIDNLFNVVPNIR